MAILNFLGRLIGAGGEAVGEGVFFRWVTRWWDRISKGTAHPIVADFIKNRIITDKGLKDNHLFARNLAYANIVPEEKKNQIRRVMNMVEADDAIRGTKYAEYFRVIVAMDEVGREAVKIERPSDVKESRYDPNWVHPGITILEDIAATCDTDDEMIAAMMAVGAFQDAPYGTVDELKFWFKTEAWPRIKTDVPRIFKAIDDKANDLAMHIDQTYAQEEAARRNRRVPGQRRTLWSVFRWLID